MHPLKGKAKASPRLNATNVYASTPYPLDGFDLGGRSPLPLAANVPIKPRATQCISLIIGDRRIRLKGRRVFRYVEELVRRDVPCTRGGGGGVRTTALK